MKTLFLIVLSILVLICVYFFILGQKSKSGSAPGLNNGRLAQCSDKPNCVCSEQASTEASSYIAALPLNGETPMDKITTIIQQLGGEIQQTDAKYLAATFTSGIFGFVDDLEIRLDTSKQVLQIRSASRVGHSDLGANRKRVENIRALYEK